MNEHHCRKEQEGYFTAVAHFSLKFQRLADRFINDLDLAVNKSHQHKTEKEKSYRKYCEGEDEIFREVDL